MQEMSLFPLRILSNASTWPRRTSSGRTGAGRARGPMPRPAVRARTSAASVLVSLAEMAGAAVGDVSSSPHAATPNNAADATKAVRTFLLI